MDDSAKKNLKFPILLFDFDGTLVSTEELAQESILEYFDEKNIQNQAQFASLIVGRTWKAAAENVFTEAARLGIQIDPAEILVKDWKKKYRARFQNGVKLIPGVIEKLLEMRKNADFMGIVTGSERDEVEAILEAHSLAHFFDRIWSAEDYQSSKPHPEPYLNAITQIDAKKEQIMVFEDSVAGVESAHRAGLKWIQILHGVHTTPDARSFKQMIDWSEFKLDWLLK